MRDDFARAESSRDAGVRITRHASPRATVPPRWPPPAAIDLRHVYEEAGLMRSDGYRYDYSRRFLFTRLLPIFRLACISNYCHSGELNTAYAVTHCDAD